MDLADAIAWPFAEGGNISERQEWLTDPMFPPYGPPQARKLRQAPRTIFNFDGLEQADTRRWMETLLAMNGAGNWHIPVVTDVDQLQTAVAAGASVVPADTVSRRFTVGGNAMLVAALDPRTHEMVRITAVAADSITIEDPLANDWPAGSTIVPTIGGKLAQAPVLPRFTGDAGAYSVTFRSSEPLDWTPNAGAASYRGYPVFELAIDWDNDPTYVPERDIEVVDNSVGVVRFYDQAGIVLPKIAFDMAMVTRAGIAAFRSLIAYLSGRWKPIWVPSQAQDIRVTTQQSASQLNIAWMGISDWPIQANRRDIRIEMANGTIYYRRITAVASISATIERITLDSNLPGGFNAAQVVGVSFMAFCMQDTDVNTLRVWGYDAILSSLTFKGVNNDF